MDAATETGPQVKRNVEAEVARIKAQMPETYAAITARAAEDRGTYGLVRRGLRGEANCFYAMEAGHVVGTPFDMPDVSAELARYMVRFGCKFLVMWAPPEGQHGAH